MLVEWVSDVQPPVHVHMYCFSYGWHIYNLLQYPLYTCNTIIYADNSPTLMTPWILDCMDLYILVCIFLDVRSNVLMRCISSNMGNVLLQEHMGYIEDAVICKSTICSLKYPLGCNGFTQWICVCICLCLCHDICLDNITRKGLATQTMLCQYSWVPL